MIAIMVISEFCDVGFTTTNTLLHHICPQNLFTSVDHFLFQVTLHLFGLFMSQVNNIIMLCFLQKPRTDAILTKHGSDSQMVQDPVNQEHMPVSNVV